MFFDYIFFFIISYFMSIQYSSRVFFAAYHGSRPEGTKKGQNTFWPFCNRI